MMSEAQRQALVKNSILVDNMTAYLARYPEDQRRIFDIVLRPIENPPKITGFTLAEPGKDYRARLCFIASIMSPEFWLQTQKLWKADAYFIVESNKDAIAQAFQTVDFKDLILNPAFHFYLGYEGDDIIAPLQRVLRQTLYAGKLYLSQVITPNRSEGIEDRFVTYAENFNVLLRKTVEHVFFNFGNINDSIEGLRASFQNFKKIQSSGGIRELENLYQDRSIVVVGAGPSLDQDLALLAENQDRFVIVAVDAAVKPLLSAGCRVDYAVTIERYQGGLQEEFFEGLPTLETELVVFPVVHPKVIDKWPGPVRFTYRNYAWFAYFEKQCPRGILESGGSASHLATKLALHMGASKVYLIGCDMSYEKHEKEEAYRSHCRSTAFPGWNAYRTEEEIRSSKEFYGFYDVEANDGSQVKTHTIYHQWAKEYGTLILANQAEGKIFSTAAKGVKVAKMPYHPLKDIVEMSPQLALPILKKVPAPEASATALDHETLYENVKGLFDHFHLAAIALEDLLLTPEIKRPDIYELAYRIFYSKVSGDTFFTAFVVQNCAMEFFRTENKLYAAPEGPIDDEHYESRCRALYDLFRVLLVITQKTLEVIDEVRQEGKKDEG
jgi:hypothetical protein